ncbi:MAG TPA: DUF6194 family protein [Chloroflexia bacterium]|nr:DUF6194 family protein [Chloroflexia bacterium]
MNEASITRYITDTFEGVDAFTVESTGDTFFFYDPDHMIPFVTLITNDNYDHFSNLNRPSVFRLNIGISKKTYNSLFGSRPSPSGGGGAADDSMTDFTALDQLMPHPVYARMYWVCVLNPGEETFQEVVQPLLAEAYEMAVSKFSKRAARRSSE